MNTAAVAPFAAASLEFLAGQLRWIHGISADLARAL